MRRLLMNGVSDPDMLVAELALGGLALALFWRFVVWVREAPVKPDPWDAETERKLAEPEIQAACVHCSTPQKPDAWFCPHCGAAVGPYNNLMPYVQIFSEGEVLRNGASQRFRNRPLVVTGYALLTLAMCPLIAPFYLLMLFKNFKQHRSDREIAGEPAGK